jgi:hypothetical protein
MKTIPAILILMTPLSLPAGGSDGRGGQSKTNSPINTHA